MPNSSILRKIDATHHRQQILQTASTTCCSWKSSLGDLTGNRGNKGVLAIEERIECKTKEHYDHVVKKGVTDHTTSQTTCKSVVDGWYKVPWGRNEMTEKGYSIEDVRTCDVTAP